MHITGNLDQILLDIGWKIQLQIILKLAFC